MVRLFETAADGILRGRAAITLHGALSERGAEACRGDSVQETKSDQLNTGLVALGVTLQAEPVAEGSDQRPIRSPFCCKSGGRKSVSGL